MEAVINNTRTEQSRSIPKLRFPEFGGEWEFQKIEDSFIFKNGLNKEKEFFGKGTPIINFTDVYKLSGIKESDINGLVQLSKSEKERFNAKKGDVFFTRTSETIDDIGMAAVLLENITDCVFSGFVLRASPTNNMLDLNFKKYCFSIHSVRKEIVTKSSMTTRALTSGTLLNKVNFNFPKEKKEQQKIATFLTTVDGKIEQLTKKKSLLEQYKKGVMQQVFSQQLRFKKEDGSEFPDWEEKKACKVFYSHSNKNHNGELPILSASQELGMVYRDSSGIKIQASEKSIKSYKIVENGDFVITLRSFQGGLDYSEIRGICSPAYTILKPYLPINHTFYKFYFKKERFIKQLSNTTVGIRDGKQITYSAFGALNIPYPSIEEQTQIANFLCAIDTKIELVNTELEKTQEFKKGLLQQMFV